MSLKRRKKAPKKKKALIAIICVISLLLVCFILSGFLFPSDTIAEGVWVGGTNLGGLTLLEAEAKLSSDDFEGFSVRADYNGQKITILPEDIELTLDIKKTAKKAYDIGKSKNIIKNSCDYWRLLFSPIHLGYVPEADTEKLDKVLYDFGVSVNGVFKDYEIEYLEDGVVVSPRTPGQNPDTHEAREAILKSIEKGVYVDIPIELKKAETEEITEAELYKKLYAVPTDAEYAYEGDEILVKEHIVGVEVEKKDLKDAVLKLNQGQSVKIKAEVVMPQVTTEDLKSKLFNATLSSYSTTYSTGAVNRASNVALAARKVNGTIVKPGEVFSYNETIGDTTIANGYKVAPVFENGKTSEGVGGGICQVSSTLYSAVLYADLKVVERRNHSLTVAYLPKGQDATVSYGAIDFKFENNTPYPIKISAQTGGGTVTVSIIGTKPDVERKVYLKHTIVSTTQPTANETLDLTLPADTKKVVSAGKTGYVVDTVKTVIENGVEVSSKRITRSTYKMVPTEISVGPKADIPASAEPSPEPTEDITPQPTPEETPEPTQIVRPTPAPAVTSEPEETEE